MAEKRTKRPRDPLSLAKLIGDIATGQASDTADDKKNPHAASLGRLGGAARAKNMTPERRKEIAAKAAKKRWAK